ncbi:MAG: flagellin lysine-N-methylase [Oscillospiraceae bacterium]|nr:flagellin lysine-N-methylase [Oscillospiraceae bacterium]
MAKREIPVRTVLMPAYYKNFHCLMGGCQDNCCDDGWKIEFSKKDYLKIKREVRSDEAKKMLAQSLVRLRAREHDTYYAEFRMNEAGRCAFHNEDGLCLLQLECGAETLPHVCQTFPRVELYTAAALEFALSPTCEGVLALLWDLPEGIDFIEEPLERKDQRVYEANSAAQACFGEIRALCIDVMQERSLRLPQRLVLLGLLFQQLRELDWEDNAAISRWLAKGEALLHAPGIGEQLEQMPRDRETYLNYGIKQIYEMGTDWGWELLNAVADFQKVGEQDWATAGFNGPAYQAFEDRLDELLGHSEYFFENLMVAATFGKGFPALSSPEDLWKSYVGLCALYSFYRCTAVCACGKEASRERLFHILVRASRHTLHNKIYFDKMIDDCFKRDNASLAYLTILVNG